ncbi:MAG: integrase [Alcanivorax sp.]|nr:integrase [Alcanivorax sp.]|tara:strand:+ start:374 stop:1717 length:1344 start_codon:yes stop_codon:yes gene_type:complete
MLREKLTPNRINRFSCSEDRKQTFLWDTEVPRLAVRATFGAKSFIFETKLNRRTIRRTIGDVRSWKIADARMEARRLQTLVDRGLDPRELDREQRERQVAAKAAHEVAKREELERQRYTLKALCEAYVAMLEAAGKKKSAGNTRSSFRCHVYDANPEVAALPAREVTPRQVAQIVRQVREAGKERGAGVLRSYLSAAFNAAKRAPLDGNLPSSLIPFQVEHNPAADIPTIPVQRGKRVLSPTELKAYMEALGPDLADQALYLALLCGGQRMAQLLRARVSDYQPETATLRLWDVKGKRAEPREHLLPLGPKANALVIQLVQRAQEMAKERRTLQVDPWLFSSTGAVPMDTGTPGKRLAEVSHAMGGKTFNLRDVRRSVETMLAALRISKDTRAQLLSHGISGVQSAHYDRHDYTEEKRAALTAWENRLAEVAEGQVTGAVVPFAKLG